MSLRNAFEGLATETVQSEVNARLTSLDAKTPALSGGSVPVSARNITTKFREAFETYTPGDRWTEILASGDIIALDGNSGGASYLVISKDPLSAGGVSSITSRQTFSMPFDASFGVHTSQRTAGQEFAIEMVSDEPLLPDPADLAIASISQAGGTLTVTTALPHGLRPGLRIGIRGVSDSRLNYPAIVVSTAPTPTQFTVTAGTSGNIPSVTAGPFTSGFVFQRSALGLATDGTSMIFENNSVTQASFYVRGNSGDAMSSGTILGNHSATILSTASAQAINAAGAYSFQPPTEFRLVQLSDGVQWTDTQIDSLNPSNSRFKRTQVVPSHLTNYRLRFRATNSQSLTVPIAQIVSAAKTGTSTATVVCDRPHGLTTADTINGFTRDATNFPGLTATVASIVNNTTFTVVWGGAATATSFGGFISRVNGGFPQQGLLTGALIQSISRVSGIISAVTNATFSAASNGDYLNLIGCRDIVSGDSLGIDGAYRLRHATGSTVELEPINAAVSPNGPDIASTNCGGVLLRRTDLRISFVRVFDFERLRTEALPRPQGDSSAAAPVQLTNTTLNVASLNGGGANEDSAATAAPVITGGVVRLTATGVGFADGDAMRDTMSGGGAKIVKPFSIAEAGWNASLALTLTTSVAIQTAAGANLKRHITALQAINTGAAVVDLIILDGTTERWRLPLPVNVPVLIEFPTEIMTTAATALNAQLSAAGTVRANFQGYTSR